MRATEITETVIVRMELQPNYPFFDKEDESTRRRATEQALRVLMANDIPSWYEWVETRFMPMEFVEVEYRTVLELDKD